MDIGEVCDVFESVEVRRECDGLLGLSTASCANGRTLIDRRVVVCKERLEVARDTGRNPPLSLTTTFRRGEPALMLGDRCRDVLTTSTTTHP